MKEILKKRRWLKGILTLTSLLLAFTVFGQDIDARSPRSAPGSSQQRKADK